MQKRFLLQNLWPEPNIQPSKDRRTGNTKSNEPLHDKTNKMTCVPSEDSDQPVHQPSLIRVFAQWVAKDPSFLHADSQDSDQTGWMPRLIWVFAGRTLILLVLSRRGSNIGVYNSFTVLIKIGSNHQYLFIKNCFLCWNYNQIYIFIEYMYILNNFCAPAASAHQGHRAFGLCIRPSTCSSVSRPG